MNLEKYEIESEIGSTYFEFVSKGIQGNIVKVVKYVKLFEDSDLYNLGFGDKNALTGELDDKVISNNGDADKVLATVALTLIEFFEEFPNAIVYTTGSSPSRTRLYQINIAKYLESIQEEFEVYGELEANLERFRKRVNYTGFYVLKHKIT
jgi:hypothetical protein